MHQMEPIHLADANDTSIGAIPIDSPTIEGHTKEEERIASPYVDAPHAFSENDYHFYGTDDQHLIWNCHNWCAAEHGTCEDYVAAIENGWREADTAGRTPPIQIGATHEPGGSNSADHPVVG